MSLFLDSATLYEWGFFFVFFGLIIGVDLFMHRKMDGPMSAKEGLAWSAVWIATAVAFGLFYILPTRGEEALGLFLTGFVLEKTLALDNLMVFSAIFAAFGLKSAGRAHLQFKVLMWGIIGAVVFRMIFLGGGAFFVQIGMVDASTALVVAAMAMIAWVSKRFWENWHPRGQFAAGLIFVAMFGSVLYYNAGLYIHNIAFEVNAMMLIFACMIAITVLPTWKGEDDDDEEGDFEHHWLVNWLGKIFPVEKDIDSGRFFSRVGGTGAWTITSLLVVTVLIEVTDVMFAFDSMPVIIAVVQDPFLMITATLMAVAGLRALYFVLDAVMRKLWLLNKGVALVLAWITIKLVYAGFGGHVDSIISLSTVVILLGAASVASLVMKPKEASVKGEQSTAA